MPVPFGGQLDIYSWFDPGGHRRVACVVAAAWLARGINAADRSLIRGLLGSSTAERVSELERTRTLAVEDSAAALRSGRNRHLDHAQQQEHAAACRCHETWRNISPREATTGVTTYELSATTSPSLATIDAAVQDRPVARRRCPAADTGAPPRGIHPPVLDNGLASALATLAASSAIPASVHRRHRPAAGAGDRDHRLLLRGRADRQCDQA